jgi:hypothetical protein
LLAKNSFYIVKTGSLKDFLTFFHKIARIQHTKNHWAGGLLFAGYLSLRPNEV